MWSQRNVGLPHIWPSGAKLSGGAPEISIALPVSDSQKFSGSLHASAESSDTYIGISPITSMPFLCA